MRSSVESERAIKITPLAVILDFIRSIRTSPRVNGSEAMVWAKLEKEFENRLANETP